MGINAAFSSWLKGAQSFATTTLRTAQGYGAALQAQTMTALSAAQRAATQPFQQAIQPRPSTRPTSSSPHTARTLTPVDAVTRAVSSGVRGVQEAAGQIVRAHAPIVQGVQRDIGRATQALPQAARSAPAAIQQGATQIARAHSPIMQGIQRDAGRAAQAIPATVRSAVSQIARAHAPIAQGIQRDAARVVSGGLGAATSGMAYANQRKAAAQAELTRTAGPAAPFEKGWTHPVYEWGREANKAYQGFVDTALPLYQRVQPLPNLPGIHSLQRGFARAPGSLLEGLSFIPPAAERAGQLLWKEPHKLPETAAKFAGQQIEGLGAAYERDPYDFAGEMIGTAALSYGIGAAARPGAVARGSGAAARPSAVARGSGSGSPSSSRPAARGSGAAARPSGAAAGSTRSSGHAGGRFRAMEFGYRTELIRKPVQKQTPFKLSEWEAERQKYARTTPTTVQTPRPAPARQVQIPVESPGTAPGGGASRQRAGYGAPYLGYRGPLSPATTTPADQAVEMLTQPQTGPQRGGVQGQRLANPQAASQDLGVVQEQGSRQDTILALVHAPVSSILDQPIVTILTTRLLNPTELVTAPPPARLKHPPVVPLLASPPRPKAKKEKKKKGNDERRRRRKLGELDHWELGPAPGIWEMSAMIFGSGRSVLNLGAAPTPGGSPLSFGFAARAPASPPVIPSFGPRAKKPAHAGGNRTKKGKGAKKKK